MCLNAIILKEITVGTFKLTKTPGIIIDNYATGAFDRVICGLALFALQSVGLALSLPRCWVQRGISAKALSKPDLVCQNDPINPLNRNKLWPRPRIHRCFRYLVYHPRYTHAYCCHILCSNYICICLWFDTTHTCWRRSY
jgi:hypothetical protein